MKKVFEQPSIALESFQTEEHLMTEEFDPFALASVSFEEV